MHKTKFVSNYTTKSFSKMLIKKHSDNIQHRLLRDIFMESIKAVKPDTLIEQSIKVGERHLEVRGKTYPIQKPCYVVGFGKAVLGMAVALETSLGSRLERGVVVVPQGIFETNEYQSKLPKSRRIEYVEGARDNMPDKSAYDGAVKIRNLIEELKTDDLLIALVSGGGSALLPLPKPPITLEEKQSLIRNLSRRGADILELNCVRKQISVLKGGGLAELAYPAKVISLVLSDIIGDPLDFIASGPTTPNGETPRDALKVIKKYDLYDDIPQSIKVVLGEENRSLNIDVPVENGRYCHVDNYVIGNNELAAQEAVKYAASLGFQSAVLSRNICGDVGVLARVYAEISRYIDSLIKGSSSKEEFKSYLRSLGAELPMLDEVIEEVINLDYSRGVCLIAAGEPTVVVKGRGKGGRNQQLVLAYSVEVNKFKLESSDISFLSGGTDGIDGPTDAAGAIGTPRLVRESEDENIEAETYLLNNDSYTFFTRYRNGENLIKIGHTGTNVMDIHILISTPMNNNAIH